MKQLLSYIVFIVIMMLIGFSASALAPVGEWYAGLNKPWFNPPNWVFPIAWTTLFILIGIAGGLIWNRGLLGLPFLFWIAQAGLNALWSILFFRFQMPAVALVEVVILLIVILGFIRSTWSDCRPAALCFVPYAAWVGFATILNATIVGMN